MQIDDYVLGRLRADAAHTIARAECEDSIQHCGLRGRLREILIANLLTPWMPPLCKCGTGMIVESSSEPRRHTQDDVLVFDPTVAPPILANEDGPEGVFPFNSVLLRIEVKSTISAAGYSDFVAASVEVARMQFHKQQDCKTKFVKPYNLLVAFKSDSSSDEWDYEFDRFRAAANDKNCLPILSGFVSAICIVDKGLWVLKKGFSEKERSWCRLDSDIKEDRLVYLVANASNTAYRARVERQGRDPAQVLEVGVGSCIPPANYRMLDDDSCDS